MIRPSSSGKSPVQSHVRAFYFFFTLFITFSIFTFLCFFFEKKKDTLVTLVLFFLYRFTFLTPFTFLLFLFFKKLFF